MSVVIRKVNIPLKLRNDLQQYLPQILDFKPFKTWQSNITANFNDEVEIKQIEIQDIDFFGSRIGFLKFKVDACWNDGTKLPGIVFSRGNSVAVFLVLNTGESDPWIVMVKQPRVPIGEMEFMELPGVII